MSTGRKPCSILEIRCGFPVSRPAVHLEGFMGFAFDPAAGCMELAARGSEIYSRTNQVVRAEKFPATHGGWFDDRARLNDAVRRLGNFSAEVTINPVRADFLARQNANRIGRIQRGEEAKPEDILCIRFLLIAVEFDRLSGTGTTAEELQPRLRSVIPSSTPTPSSGGTRSGGATGTGLTCWSRSGNSATNRKPPRG